MPILDLDTYVGLGERWHRQLWLRDINIGGGVLLLAISGGARGEARKARQVS